MKTVTMTEFNQHPSRIAHLAENGEVVVLRRGVPVLRVSPIRTHAVEDPLDRLVRLGLARPAQAHTERTTKFPSIATDVDLGAMLDDDRKRLDE